MDPNFFFTVALGVQAHSSPFQAGAALLKMTPALAEPPDAAQRARHDPFAPGYRR